HLLKHWARLGRIACPARRGGGLLHRLQLFRALLLQFLDHSLRPDDVGVLLGVLLKKRVQLRLLARDASLALWHRRLDPRSLRLENRRLASKLALVGVA